MDTSARLGLPYLAPAQLQKHVTLNEALTRLDVLVQCAAVSRTVTSQPPDPADGDLYILPGGAAGSRWSGFLPGALVRFEAGGWAVQPVAEGVLVWIADEATAVVRHDGDWRPWGETLGAVQNLDRLGLNTTADAANPFAARLNKALWTARNAGDGGDGDLRMTFNKQADVNVGSLLFQSDYSGRAELGLVGDDDLTLKVSADGSVWRAAMAVDRTTGAVAFPAGGGRAETFVVATSGSWTPPAWARRLDILVVGAGGGGGAGAAGPSGAPRFGGGGGGAGGVVMASWATADLTSALFIVVGAPGSAGVPGVSGVEFSGGSGGSTTLAVSGHVLLTAPGGLGGQGGDAVSGLGGGGGAGIPISNGGGDSRVGAAAFPGASLQRPDASGGGGAGGGLDASNVARHGGSGGAGGTLTRLMAGGTGGSGAAGGAGAASPAPALSWAGGGGGGGGASLTTGHAGGAGAVGAGGGGGGAGVSASGPGGLGGAGFVRIVAVG